MLALWCSAVVWRQEASSSAVATPCSGPSKLLPVPPSTEQQATLSQVLRAYQHVLRSAGLDPEADTHFYRALLRLSLDREEGCWWGRLYREITGNCRWGGGRWVGRQALTSAELRCPYRPEANIPVLLRCNPPKTARCLLLSTPQAPWRVAGATADAAECVAALPHGQRYS